MDRSSSATPSISQSNNMPIRDAATVLVLRKDKGAEATSEDVRVLMGKRANKAAFMPNKYVFPGGAVDPADSSARPAGIVSELCRQRLMYDAHEDLTQAFMNAGVRELREETGLILPDSAELTFVFRAITPPGRTRRFDARFFVAWADDVENDLDDFSNAENELTQLQWVSLIDAFALDIPLVTKLALESLLQRLPNQLRTYPVPFYDMRNAEGQLYTIA